MRTGTGGTRVTTCANVIGPCRWGYIRIQNVVLYALADNLEVLGDLFVHENFWMTRLSKLKKREIVYRKKWMCAWWRKRNLSRRYHERKKRQKRWISLLRTFAGAWFFWRSRSMIWWTHNKNCVLVRHWRLRAAIGLRTSCCKLLRLYTRGLRSVLQT